jgi:hypothetical protein
MKLGDVALKRNDLVAAVKHYTKCKRLMAGIVVGKWML